MSWLLIDFKHSKYFEISSFTGKYSFYPQKIPYKIVPLGVKNRLKWMKLFISNDGHLADHLKNK